MLSLVKILYSPEAKEKAAGTRKKSNKTEKEVKKPSTRKTTSKTTTKKEKIVEPVIEETKAGFDYSNAEVILDVRHLKQYFKFGRGEYKYNKAVHDVSFKVYKGEVFGLVGESGCGKTTTGRSIIKLYQITSGDVWFKGVRIAAGTRWNRKEIKFTRLRLKEFLSKIRIEKDAEYNILQEEYQDKYGYSFSLKEVRQEVEEGVTDTASEKRVYLERYQNIIEKFNNLSSEEIARSNKIINAEREKIKSAKHDDRYCDRDIMRSEVKKVKEKYADLIEKKKQGLNEEEQKLYEEYKKELAAAKQAKITSKIQMIFQDPIASLNPRMTVHDIISEGLVIRGIKDKNFISSEVNRVLQLVGLVPEHANRYPHEFSGGQRQRIGIARAIIMNPELIIADEPVSALDVSIQAQVINLLNDLRNDLGLTILFIAHNLSVVKYFCDRIAVMYFGNLVELATSDELFAHPFHPYTKSLLSAVPHPDPNIERNRTRIVYNAAESHDYSKQKPVLREVVPGHFVLCNDEEEQKYLKEYNSGKSAYAK